MRSLYEHTPYKPINTVIQESIEKDERGVPLRSSFYSAKYIEMLSDYQKNGQHWSLETFKIFFNEGFLQHIVGLITEYSFNIDYLNATNRKEGLPLRVHDLIYRIRSIVEYFEITIQLPKDGSCSYVQENTLTRLMVEQSWFHEVITPLLAKLKESNSLSTVGAKSQKVKRQIDRLHHAHAQCQDPKQREQLQKKIDDLQRYQEELNQRICDVVINYLRDLRRFINLQLQEFYKDGCPEGVKLTELRDIVRGFSAEGCFLGLLSPYLTPGERGEMKWYPHHMIKVKNPLYDPTAPLSFNASSSINGFNYLFPFAIGLITIAQSELSQPLESQPVLNKIAQIFESCPRNVLENKIKSLTIKNANNIFVHELSEQLYQLLIKNRLATVSGGLEKKGFPFGFSAISHITNLFWYYYDGSSKHHLENPAYLDEVTREQIITCVKDIKARETRGEIIVEQAGTCYELTSDGKWLLVSWLMHYLNIPCHDNPSLMLNVEVMKNFSFGYLEARFLYLYKAPANFLVKQTLDNPIIDFYVNHTPKHAFGTCLSSIDDLKAFMLGMLRTVVTFKIINNQENVFVKTVAIEKKLSSLGVQLLLSALLSDVQKKIPIPSNEPDSYQNPKAHPNENVNKRDENLNKRERQSQGIFHSSNTTGARKNIPTNTVSKQPTSKGKEHDDGFELETFQEANSAENSTAPFLRRNDKTVTTSAKIPTRTQYGALSLANKPPAENRTAAPKTTNPIDPLVHTRSLLFYASKNDILFLASEYFNIQVNIYPDAPCLLDGASPIIHIHELPDRSWHTLIDPLPRNNGVIHDKFIAYQQYIESGHLSKSEIINVLSNYIPGVVMLIVPEPFKPPKRHLDLVNKIITLCKETSTTPSDAMTYLINKLPWQGALEAEFEKMTDYLCYRHYGIRYELVLAKMSLNTELSTPEAPRRAVRNT